MQVKDVMHRAICIAPEDQLATAVRMLTDERIGCLRVCEGGSVVGMLTDRDIALRAIATARGVHGTTVREIMSVGAVCCSQDDSLEEAVRLMRRVHLRRLVVLDRRSAVTGVISAGDISALRVVHGGIELITHVDGFRSRPRPFEVVFYKEVLDHAGYPHRSQLMRMSVARSTGDEAVRAAIHQFEEIRHVSRWDALADGYDVEDKHSPGDC
ncbi:CBS domain-containing protein [Caballeronia sp. AZ1_KS37]|uniref:CBS domain-containing protein n=1 Tax=Caballeronia sp. AZ1_KS37 TaxID=2921756 RepID=UPI002028C848|nr:CBS domain-containing protein [Caballeronia sp. AZ1_KS37]